MLASLCDCGQPAARTVTVSTIPGSGDGKLVRFAICDRCYEVYGWADADLTPQSEMWELAQGEARDVLR